MIYTASIAARLLEIAHRDTGESHRMEIFFWRSITRRKTAA
jgi:hypothetical protein